jgi:hypothetical protein
MQKDAWGMSCRRWLAAVESEATYDFSDISAMWLRFLGAKVGRHAEVSTTEGLVPELLVLGDDCFVADGAMLGDEEQSGGVHLGSLTLGAKGECLPAATRWEGPSPCRLEEQEGCPPTYPP